MSEVASVLPELHSEAPSNEVLAAVEEVELKFKARLPTPLTVHAKVSSFFLGYKEPDSCVHCLQALSIQLEKDFQPPEHAVQCALCKLHFVAWKQAEQNFSAKYANTKSEAMWASYCKQRSWKSCPQCDFRACPHCCTESKLKSHTKLCKSNSSLQISAKQMGEYNACVAKVQFRLGWPWLARFGTGLQ